ncbi:MAG: c-type cytochrome [Pseudomonadota bacterium]
MNDIEDAAFVRTFSIVLGGLVVIGVLAFVIAKIVSAGFLETQNYDEAKSERIQQVGQVNIGDVAVVVGGGDDVVGAASDATADADLPPGARVYGALCFSCHDQGIAGAPKIGDLTAWAGRTDKGREALVANAINGYQGELGIMPARGGNPKLTDDEVSAAVDFMLEKLSGDAPSASAPIAKEPVASEPVASEPAADEIAAAPEPIAQASNSEAGKNVYDMACTICHAHGVAGAPKFGDAGAWSPRIAQGIDTLYQHSLKGFMGSNGMMPPKGGRPDLSDDDVRAAVDYMTASVQ